MTRNISFCDEDFLRFTEPGGSCADVKRLGFEPGNQYDDSALGLMVRTHVMPIRFAHGITASEADEMFTELKGEHCW